MALKGIDISHHQNGIDLTRVHFDFAIMKATEGTGFVDNCCDKFYQVAKSLGKCLGVYHYANGGDYKAEADFFLNNIKGYIGEAILCLDWERQNNTLFCTGADNQWIKNWCDYVYSQTGVRPLVYIQMSALSRVEGIGNYGLWVAQYGSNNVTGYQDEPWNEGVYMCAIRQYTSNGQLPGYAGRLDLDKFYGDRTAWNKYAGRTEQKVESTDPVQKTEPSGTIIDLVYETMLGVYGDGEQRKQALGSRYEGVQNKINYIATVSAQILAQEVKQGLYGNGERRMTILGNRYNEVQKIINQDAGVAPVYYVVKSGDTLSAIAYKYKTTYKKIAQLNGISNPNKIYVGQKLRIK